MTCTDVRTQTLPCIKGELNFEFANGTMKLTVDMYDSDEQIKLIRCNGRWRWPGGPYTSRHRIASRIFSYRKDPSEEEMYWMGDYIDDIGRLLDVASEAICDGVKRTLEERENRLAKSFYSQNLANYASYSTNKATFVYLMRHVNGLTKIGESSNPKAREKTLQAEDPRLEILFYWEASTMVERRLHKIFECVRVRGEWFKLECHHIDWIRFLLASK